MDSSTFALPVAYIVLATCPPSSFYLPTSPPHHKVRMPNPGIFHSTCKTWLLDKLPTYAAAVQSGCLGNVLPDIHHRYFKRPPIPDITEVGEAMHAAALAAETQYKTSLTKITGQLRNFFQYQYGKSLELSSAESGLMNPYTAFHHKFLGLSAGKPHRKSAHNIWRRTHRDEVKAEFKTFNALPGNEKLFWESKACEEFEADTKAWKDAQSAPPPTDPASRQRGIEQTPSFATPFLNALADTMGWKWLLISRGPEPADGGRLNIMIIGTKDTTGPVGLSFIQSQQESYKKNVLPVWANHLHMCYTPDECRLRALSGQGSTASELGLEKDNTILETALSHAPSRAPSEPPSCASSPTLSQPGELGNRSEANVGAPPVTNNPSVSVGAPSASSNINITAPSIANPSASAGKRARTEPSDNNLSPKRQLIN
ncbi:hypothetical protein DXG01_001771 [Tephrocybe rancida]|nr:hypothetical protein DXG01_001771 [Tephrocybe rancida]